MKIVNAQLVSIPVTQSSSDKRFTNGTLYGSGNVALVFSNMDTNDQNDDELRGIKIPKLLINSENDDGAKDNRLMIEIFCEPKELQFYNGNAHGTELFDQERESIIKKLQHFIKLSLTI